MHTRSALPLFAAFVAVALALPGCATRLREVTRDEWVVVPTKADESAQEVLRRDDYIDQLRRGERRKTGGSLSKRPPALLDTPSPLHLKAGDVLSFTVEDEPVRRMLVNGNSAEIFWSKPYEIRRREQGAFVAHQGADVHVRAVGEGRTVLRLELVDGTERTYDIVVEGSRV